MQIWLRVLLPYRTYIDQLSQCLCRLYCQADETLYELIELYIIIMIPLSIDHRLLLQIDVMPSVLLDHRLYFLLRLCFRLVLHVF